jgi:chromatin remodeling complex protein RSC6
MDFSEDFSDLLENLSQLKKNITVIQNQVKTLELKKGKNKKKNNSGFAKPTKISDELCEFMGREKGTELARTEVTKYIHEYIKKNSLQVESNKTLIVPDSSLKNLLALEDDVAKEIHFFSLQKYMNRHFV